MLTKYPFLRVCRAISVPLPKTMVCGLTLLIGTLCCAHGIDMQCRGKDEIRCQGTFSDGESLTGTPVRVLSYSDVVQWKGSVDAQGKVTFKRPKEKFYIQFVGADGHLYEVDQKLIKP